jgi:hypothetical protein
MHLIKRLWQRWQDRRVERQGLKGRWRGEAKRSQETTPSVGIVEEAGLRWRIKSGKH